MLQFKNILCLSLLLLLLQGCTPDAPRQTEVEDEVAGLRDEVEHPVSAEMVTTPGLLNSPIAAKDINKSSASVFEVDYSPFDLGGLRGEATAAVGAGIEAANAPSPAQEQELEASAAPATSKSIEMRLAKPTYSDVSKAADQGDVEAQSKLGLMYENGDGVGKNPEEAVKWHRKAAEQGHAEAQTNLGRCYYKGVGVSVDFTQAVAWFRKAAAQDNARAQANLGYCFALGKGVPVDEKEAIVWYRKAAEQGNASAQFSLWQCYTNGWGVPVDSEEAKKWHSKAAEQAGANVNSELDEVIIEIERDSDFYERARTGADKGIADDQFRLGVAYARGKGVAKDLGEALAWFRKAAEQNHAGALSSLGDCFYNGTGVPKDEKEAVTWYRKAAEQGDIEAKVYLGWMYANGEGVKKDDGESIKWYHAIKADSDRAATIQGLNESFWPKYWAKVRADNNEKEAVKWYAAGANTESGPYLAGMAQFNLAVCYAEGTGVPKDEKVAVKWYRKAAENGNVEAQIELGSMYLSGKGAKKNVPEGIRWYTTAAEQNDPEAQWRLACLYSYDDDVKKDENAAFNWYKRAAEQGHTYAQNSLGMCYKNGWGVQKDAKEGSRWYRKAAEQGDNSAQYNLGNSYLNGDGVPKDFVYGYAWLNLAAIMTPEAGTLRDGAAKSMTADQVAAAQRLSSELASAIEARQAGADATSVADTPGEIPLPKSTGTAFMVEGTGYALTAAHVVSGAARIEIVKDGKQFPAAVFVMDAANDVAVIKVERAATATLPVSSSSGTTLGASVFTIGYPNISVQGSSPKLTKGEINSLAGIQDDPRFFQVNVAVQPGNSGGPLVNEHGEVVGIVVGQLDQSVSLATSGALQQNVNYALKSAYFLPLLDSIPGFTTNRANQMHISARVVHRKRRVAATDFGMARPPVSGAAGLVRRKGFGWC